MRIDWAGTLMIAVVSLVVIVLVFRIATIRKTLTGIA
jgi:hypothetical protein